jgi:hypothetical protein
MTHRLLLVRAALCVALAAASSCSEVDLKTAVQIADVSSGYYDAGLTPEGLNKLVPSLTFTVRNGADTPLSSVDMVALFWQVGKDAEMDELVVKVIGGDAVAPGASSEPVVLRASVGYTTGGPRAELFGHPNFLDITAKLFVKRGGRIMPAGEYKIDRKILLSAPTK